MPLPVIAYNSFYGLAARAASKSVSALADKCCGWLTSLNDAEGHAGIKWRFTDEMEFKSMKADESAMKRYQNDTIETLMEEAIENGVLVTSGRARVKAMLISGRLNLVSGENRVCSRARR